MAAQISTHITLLRGLQAGDASHAWGEFLHRYGGLIRSVAVRHGLQAADADDVVQEVLIGLSRAMTTFEYDPARARFRTFLQRIVQRAVFNRFRQNKSANRIEDVEITAAAEQHADEIWEADWRQYHIARAMQAIEVEFSSKDREIFAAYVGQTRSATETAEALGVSLDQVYQAKSRILARLSALVAAQIDEEG